MAYLLGIDVGTSGTKALLIDHRGKVVARAVSEYPLYTPKPLWAEQEPADWWRATCESIREVLRQAGITGEQVQGMGLSGQMHGSVFLDENNQVIRPAILWCDQRTAAECAWITETVGRERVVELTSNPVLTGFQAGKIIWLRNNEPGAYARVRKVLLPKDYIRYLLTGEYATEVSDASGTSLFNVRKRQWADEVLDAIGIPREWMPRVYESPRNHRTYHCRSGGGNRVERRHSRRGRRRRPGGRRGRQRHRGDGRGVGVGRHIGCGVRLRRRAGGRPRLAHAHLLPCGTRQVARDGRDAVGRR